MSVLPQIFATKMEVYCEINKKRIKKDNEKERKKVFSVRFFKCNMYENLIGDQINII